MAASAHTAGTQQAWGGTAFSSLQGSGVGLVPSSPISHPQPLSLCLAGVVGVEDAQAPRPGSPETLLLAVATEGLQGPSCVGLRLQHSPPQSSNCAMGAVPHTSPSTSDKAEVAINPEANPHLGLAAC